MTCQVFVNAIYIVFMTAALHTQLHVSGYIWDYHVMMSNNLT